MNNPTAKKVAIVHNSYGKTSGEEIVIENLAALVAKRGLTVLRFGRSSAEIETKRLGKISAFFSGIHNPFSKKAFGQFLKETSPDIVHIHNLYPLISPSILSECTARGIPVVMTVHNFRLVCPNGLLLSQGEVCHRCLDGREYWCVLRNCENDILKSIGYALRTAVARILHRYYDNVNHFICLSEFQRDIHVKEGLPADCVTILANPVSLASETISIEGNRRYVAYVGRISPEKDILTLIEAARRLGNLQFKFAGSYQRLPEVIKQKPDNCEFLGQLNTEDIVKFYHNARMVVFATRCYEGFPTVLLEAMSHSLPVICSRIGGLPEIVEDGITGLLYEPGNIDELTDCIQQLWQNPSLSQNMGEAGKQKLLEDYAVEHLMDRLIEIYEKVIAESTGR